MSLKSLSNRYWLISLLLFAPFYLKAQNNNVHILGKISNYAVSTKTAKNIQIWVRNALRDDEDVTDLKIKPDGSFGGNVPLDHVQEIDLLYGDVKLLFFAAPRDSLTLTFQTADPLKTMVVEGSAINKELIAYQIAQSGYWRTINKQIQVKEKGKINEFKQFVLDSYKNEVALYNAYIAQNNTSELFKKWSKIDLDYRYGGALISYISNATLGVTNKNLPESYFDFFKQFPLENPDGGFSSAYLKYLSGYNFYLGNKFKTDISVSTMSKFLLAYPDKLTDKQLKRVKKLAIVIKPSIFDLLFFSKLMQENDGEKQDLITNDIQLYGYDKLIAFYINNSSGFSRSVLLSAYIYQLIDEGKAVDFVKQRINTINAAIGTDYLHQQLLAELNNGEQKLKQYTLASNSNINFVPVTASDSILDKIIAKYRGKVVYVDFWGTWCVPCMEAMPHAKALFENYIGKDVVLVFLAVTSKEDIWKSVIANTKIPGEHYLLKNSQEKALSNKFHISGYPHYLLIDKLGYVKDSNAKHPDDSALRNEIDAMLQAKN